MGIPCGWGALRAGGSKPTRSGARTGKSSTRAGRCGTARRAEILFWQFETSKLPRDSGGKPLPDDKGQPVYETKSLAYPRAFRYTVSAAEQQDGLPPRPGDSGLARGTRTRKPIACSSSPVR